MIEVEKYLAEHNVKPSVQRCSIMQYLLTHKTHPTVDEVYLALHPQMPTLSKTTVYNTLKLLVESGLALQLNIDAESVRFDGDTSNHAHFCCNKCGCIIDFFPKDISAINNVCINHLGGIKIDETQVYYKGLCEKCNE